MKIEYVKGDATNPIGDGKKIILHCCNDIGAWGSGFVLALSKKWPTPERAFRSLKKPELGHLQLVKVSDKTMVGNIIGQSGIASVNNPRPVRYDALKEGFIKTLSFIDSSSDKDSFSIHMPMLGAGLAGGDWSIIEGVINEVFENTPYRVVVYIFD